MAKITPFLYCDQFQTINIANKQVQTPLGITNIFIFDYFPSRFTFGVLFGLVEIDLNKDNSIRYRFIDSLGNVLFDTPDTLLRLPDDLVKEMPENGHNIVVNFDLRNIEIKQPGKHKSQVFLNNELLGEFEIGIFRRNNHRGNES